jgi:hypothetical protein
VPAARYSKGDIISVQIGVRNLNTAAWPHAPGWSRYIQYHIPFGPYQSIVTTTTARRTYRSCVVCVSHVRDELTRFFTTVKSWAG